MLILTLIALYLAIGLVFAVAFVIRGVDHIDPDAKGGTIGFRLLIIPGCTLYWPYLAWRWRTRSQPPTESTPHINAARS